MQPVIDQLRLLADVILVDTPPVLVAPGHRHHRQLHPWEPIVVAAEGKTEPIRPRTDGAPPGDDQLPGPRCRPQPGAPGVGQRLPGLRLPPMTRPATARPRRPTPGRSHPPAPIPGMSLIRPRTARRPDWRRPPRRGSGPSRRTVDVVVVAYGAPELLDACLGSPSTGSLPVVVVDNSSLPVVHELVCDRHGARYVDPGPQPRLRRRGQPWRSGSRRRWIGTTPRPRTGPSCC